MKKILLWGGLIAVLVLLVMWMISGYNNMVVLEENVENAWAQVQSQYQRRSDLIPNIQKTAEGLAIIEKQTFTEVTEARSKASQVTIDPAHMTEAQLAAFQEAQGELSSVLSRLLVSLERYPELNSHKEFHELIIELEGTENRIAVARNNFNKEAQVFNTFVRRFPNNIVASIFNFEKKPYFKADEGAEKAPEVKFNFGNNE